MERKPSEAGEPRASGKRKVGALSSYYIADAIGALGFLCVTPLLIRHFGGVQYGLLALAQALVGYMGVLDLGVKPSLTRMVALAWATEDRGRVRQLLSTSLAFFAAAGLIAAAAAVLFAWMMPTVFSSWANEDMLAARPFIAIRGVQFALALFFGAFESSNYGMNRVVQINGIRAVSTVTELAAGVVAVVLGLPLWFVAAVGLLTTLMSGVLNARIFRQSFTGFTFSRGDVQPAVLLELIRFGFYFLIDGMVVLLVFKTDEVVIASCIGLAAVALYAPLNEVTRAILQAVLRIPASSWPVLAAHVARAELTEARVIFVQTMSRSAAVAAALAVPAIVCGPRLASGWLGHEIPAGLPWMLALIPLVHVPVSVSSKYLAAAGNLRSVTWVAILEACINLGLSLALVGPFGLTGVAAGTLIAQVCTATWFNPRQACIGLGLPYGFLAKRLVTAVAGAAIPTIAWTFACGVLLTSTGIASVIPLAALSLVGAMASVAWVWRRVL
jgi:O-antigen/teichoic acid export membrane protein